MESSHEPPLALEAFFRLPDDGRRYELTRGRLVAEPSPGFRHGRIAMRIAAALDAHVRQHGLGVVVTCDTGFVLSRNPDTVRAPDVAFVTRKRFLALEDESRPFPGPPDLAVEVLSPSDRAGEIAARVSDYLAADTGLLWLIDPQAATVSVYDGRSGPAVLGVSDVLTAGGQLAGFRVAVIELFRL